MISPRLGFAAVVISGLLLSSCRNKGELDTSLRTHEPSSPSFQNGTLIFPNPSVESVRWGADGFRVTFMAYYGNYHLNVNRHSAGKLAIKGIGVSLDHGGPVSEDLANVPDASKPLALVRIVYTDSQFLDLASGAFKYFLDSYLVSADATYKAKFSGYNSLVANEATFTAELSRFLASLPQK